MIASKFVCGGDPLSILLLLDYLLLTEQSHIQHVAVCMVEMNYQLSEK